MRQILKTLMETEEKRVCEFKHVLIVMIQAMPHAATHTDGQIDGQAGGWAHARTCSHARTHALHMHTQLHREFATRIQSAYTALPAQLSMGRQPLEPGTPVAADELGGSALPVCHRSDRHQKHSFPTVAARDHCVVV